MIVGNYIIRRLFFTKQPEAGVVDVCSLRKNDQPGPILKFYRFTDREEQNRMYLKALDFVKAQHKSRLLNRQFCSRCRAAMKKA